jgi:hypothetical protein
MVDGGDLSTSRAASDLAILKHLFMPDRTGITASQAWLTGPATAAFTWLDKSYGNEECQTCCKIADAAIAVPRNLGGMEASLTSPELRTESRGLSPAINPGSIGLGRKNRALQGACLCRRTGPLGITFNPAIVSIIGGGSACHAILFEMLTIQLCLRSLRCDGPVLT